MRHGCMYTENVGKKESEVFSALARARWAKATPEDRAQNSRNLLKARWEGSTPEERSAAASAAAKARWAKAKKAKKAEK